MITSEHFAFKLGRGPYFFAIPKWEGALILLRPGQKSEGGLIPKGGAYFGSSRPKVGRGPYTKVGLIHEILRYKSIKYTKPQQQKKMHTNVS